MNAQTLVDSLTRIRVADNCGKAVTPDGVHEVPREVDIEFAVPDGKYEVARSAVNESVRIDYDGQRFNAFVTLFEYGPGGGRMHLTLSGGPLPV